MASVGPHRRGVRPPRAPAGRAGLADADRERSMEEGQP